MLNDQSVQCDSCADMPPPFFRVCALFKYKPPLTKIIYRLKFGGRLDYVRPLGNLMANKIINSWYEGGALPEVIIPVPLSKQRYQERGYNQSMELGKIIAKNVHIPLETSVCLRIRNTKMQAQLAKMARGKNLRGAFVPRKTATHVAVLDDVVTTGNTVRALSYALQAAGTERIDIWAICRG